MNKYNPEDTRRQRAAGSASAPPRAAPALSETTVARGYASTGSTSTAEHSAELSLVDDDGSFTAAEQPLGRRGEHLAGGRDLQVIDWEGTLPDALGDVGNLEANITRGLMEAVRLRT